MESTKNPAIKDSCKRYGSFVPADVLSAFDVEFLDDDWCQTWVMERLHPDNAALCPGCGADIPESLMHSFWDCNRIKCARCGKYFTALTGTFLSGSHFGFREIVLLAFLIALGVSDKQIAALLKISTENIRLWKLKFKELESDDSGK